MLDGRVIPELLGVRWVGTEEWKECRRSGCGNVLIYFRAVVDAAAGSRCNLLISANNRYKLWVNGARAGEGPCRGDRWRHFFDRVDIGPLLIDGPNVIAAEVLYYPPALLQDGRKTGPMCVTTNHLGPMLAVGGALETPDGRVTDLSTGKFSWQYRRDDAVAWELRDAQAFLVVGAFEHVDGARIPEGWKADPGSLAGWRDAGVCYEATGSAWGNMVPLPPAMRPIPAMFHREKPFVRVMQSSVEGLAARFDSVEVPAGSSFFMELDAGELTTGYIRLRTSGGAGSSVRVTYAESYSAPPQTQYRRKDRRDDFANYELFGCYDVYRPSGADDGYEPFWWRTFRFVRVEATAGEEPLRLMEPDFVDVGYPLEELSAVLSRSCGWIEPLWRVSVRTVQRCTHETHEDCPYYEQLQYSLDTRLQILFAYAMGNDAALARKTIEDFHSTLMPEGLTYCRAPSDEPAVIPVFSLYWIMMLEDYYQQTGDIGFVNFFRPTVDAVLAWFDRHLGQEGLVEHVYYWEFIDWVEAWQDSRGTITAVPDSARDTGRCTTTSLIYAAALGSAARLLGHSRRETAQEYDRRADAVRASVERHCWDGDRGMYREGIGTAEYTQHAQAFAVLSGLAAGDRAKLVLENALSGQDVLQCTYVFAFFLFRALERAGLYGLTEGQWSKWTDALDRGVTTWPEDLRRQRSDCHGWGSLPIYEFIRCFLGVRPLKPGYEAILVQPVCTYVPDLEGRAMTPRGPVEVQLAISGGRMRITGRVPAGVPAIVRGPIGGELSLPAGGDFEAEFPMD